MASQSRFAFPQAYLSALKMCPQNSIVYVVFQSCSLCLPVSWRWDIQTAWVSSRLVHFANWRGEPGLGEVGGEVFFVGAGEANHQKDPDLTLGE
jgi:hypothetical protein